MNIEGFRYYNPRGQTEVWQNRLPHWQQQNAAYFLTFHLADSIPSSLLRRWESDRAIWLSHHPEPWTVEEESEYHQRFSGAIERWLDAGHGACILRDLEHRRVVEEAVMHFEAKRHHHISWVIMPNYVHALFILIADEMLESLLHSWKSFSSKKVNLLLGRTGALWQKDYFDRLVRDGEHLDNCIRYIRHNPEKAKLHEGEFTLFESDFAKRVL